MNPKPQIIHLTNDEDVERFYRQFRDARLATVPKPADCPKVGDTVVLNDGGLVQCFGSSAGMMRHLKKVRMRITRVDDESTTYPEPTFIVEVDNEDVNCFLIDHHCFDIVENP